MSDAALEVPARQAHDAVAAGEGVLVDVREPWEYEEQRIAGATLIPMAQVVGRVDEIPVDRDVYVYCKVGARSARVVEYLRRQGRERTASISGGIDAWVEEGFPVEP